MLINVPVAKTHGSKITCCMKNHFGLLPGRLYGWSKDRGTEGHRGIPHSPGIVDEAWIDLWTLTQVDLNVVDMLAGTEAGAFTGAPRRSNLIVAGRSPVATDLVVARLMGFNPDDFEFAELARQRGLGPASIDSVEVVGAQVGPLVHRFKKAGAAYGSWGEWGQHAEYGMGPRWWTLLGPLPVDHAFPAAELAALETRRSKTIPGVTWSMRQLWVEKAHRREGLATPDEPRPGPLLAEARVVLDLLLAHLDDVRPARHGLAAGRERIR